MRVVVQAWELLLRYQNGIMAAAFICSIALVAFGAGALASQYRVYPYHLLRQVGVSARAIHKEVTGNTIEAREMRVSEFSTTEAAANRIGDPRALSSGLLWHGGNGLFREICLERGCLAVEFSDSGEVVHAYPYRLDELQDWPKIVQLPRKAALPFETPRPATTVNSARKYSNGDILVIIKFSNSDPEDGIVARIDRDGRPMWVRDDYSHHWTVIFQGPGGEELALVPASTFGDHPIGSRLRGNTNIVGPRLDCWDGSINQVDHLRVLRGDGSILQDFRIIDSIIDSPFASLLLQAHNPCDVLHLNYIDRIRGDVRDIPGVEPGDYVVSLRNISAFGIMDSETGEMKRLVRGSFIFQHSVQHLGGSEFLLFDNFGSDAIAGPSRVLLVDLGGGAVRERTVFPVAGTPDEHRIFSRVRGNIAISADRERMIIASSDQGIALEVRLSDGSVLNVFRNVHDLSGLGHNHEDAGDRAVYLAMKDLQYVE